MVNKVETEAASKKISADQEAAILEMRAEAQYEASKSRYEAAIVESEAEMANVAGLDAMRKHHLAMAKSEVLQEIARRAKIVMSGTTGDALLKDLLG